MTTVRVAAARVLLAVEAGNTTLAAEVERARHTLDDDRDRALLLELSTGVLRWRAELDALVAHCSERPLEGMDPRVRAILRLAAYQLEHLDRIPAHAVVHEAVEMTRALEAPRAAGFVNAVLRNLSKTPRVWSLPSRGGPGDQRGRLAYLTTTLSHPEWLVSRWLTRFSFEQVEAWCQFNNRTPEVTIRSAGRINTAELLAALDEAGLEPQPAPFVRDAIRLPTGSLGRVPEELHDEFLIQDEASQIVAHAVGAAPGERVLDLCAAPGGKTVVLSRDMTAATDWHPTGTLVACDRRPARLRLLKATLGRAGVSPRLVGLDATQPLPFGPIFDRVLVDAPCSGLGTVRRDPDLKWSRTPIDLAGFAKAQVAMLRQAAEAVRPGGMLVYATCSSEPDENDLVVEAFLTGESRFALQPIQLGTAVANGQDLVDATGYLRTLPFRDGLDGFFAAVLVRRVPT